MRILEGYKAAFAEGPFWDEETNKLLYIDLPHCAVIEHDIEQDLATSWHFETPVTSIIKHDSAHYLLITNQKIMLFNRFTTHVEDYFVFDDLEPFHLLNDAKKDAAGNIWVGTVDDRYKYFKENPETALQIYPHSPSHLYRLSPSKELTKYNFPVTLSNGLAFRNDRQLFYVDSATQAIWLLTFNEQYELLERTKFFECDQLDGFPDGITIDANGDLWSPLFKSRFLVTNYDKTSKLLKICGQTGTVLETHVFHVSHITSCQFGGENLQYLFMTTANDLLIEEEKALQVDAGKIHQLSVGVYGVPTTIASQI